MQISRKSETLERQSYKGENSGYPSVFISFSFPGKGLLAWNLLRFFKDIVGFSMWPQNATYSLTSPAQKSKSLDISLF